MSRRFGTGSDYVHLAQAVVTAPPLTVAALVKLNVLLDTPKIITIGTNGSGTNRFTLSMANGGVECNENDGTSSIATSSAAIKDIDDWHHIAGVWTNHTNRAAFLDGFNKGTVAVLKAAAGMNVTRIGCDPVGANPAQMLIQSVAIWNVALDDAEIALLGARKISPWELHLRRPNLVYWVDALGLRNNEVELVNKLALTVTGANPHRAEPRLGWVQEQIWQNALDEGVGPIVGAVSAAFDATGALTGAGALVGNTSAVFSISGALTGAGALAGAVASSFAVSGALTGSGVLAGAVSSAFAASGVMSGAGALLGATGATFGVTGLLTGAGALAGAVSAAFGVNGALTGMGALVGAVNSVFAAVGALTGAGSLSGAVAAAFGLSGVLTSSAMVAALAAAFAVSGLLSGAGALAGAIALMFSMDSSALTDSSGGAGTGGSWIVRVRRRMTR